MWAVTATPAPTAETVTPREPPRRPGPHAADGLRRFRHAGHYCRPRLLWARTCHHLGTPTINRSWDLLMSSFLCGNCVFGVNARGDRSGE